MSILKKENYGQEDQNFQEDILPNGEDNSDFYALDNSVSNDEEQKINTAFSINSNPLNHSDPGPNGNDDLDEDEDEDDLEDLQDDPDDLDDDFNEQENEINEDDDEDDDDDDDDSERSGLDDKHVRNDLFNVERLYKNDPLNSHLL